jgi:transglutaminase-like putative cysteine protease
VALLAATGRLDAGVDARVASGARLWLLAGAVASALAGPPDPFHAWGRLVAAGWWPVGPSRGRLVMSASA